MIMIKNSRTGGQAPCPSFILQYKVLIVFEVFLNFTKGIKRLMYLRGQSACPCVLLLIES